MATVTTLRCYVRSNGSDIQTSRSGFAPLLPPMPEAGVLSRVTEWLDRQRQRVILAQLEDRLLADIGVSRAEALREARRWT
jgi:uncharacterized protein YjiS (DUF1127 family)